MHGAVELSVHESHVTESGPHGQQYSATDVWSISISAPSCACELQDEIAVGPEPGHDMYDRV